MNKKSDLIENLLYSDNSDFSVDTKYEQFIIELMIENWYDIEKRTDI